MAVGGRQEGDGREPDGGRGSRVQEGQIAGVGGNGRGQEGQMAVAGGGWGQNCRVATIKPR